jgi:hypothetical protein
MARPALADSHADASISHASHEATIFIQNRSTLKMNYENYGLHNNWSIYTG